MLAGNAVSHLAERQSACFSDGAIARIDKANGLSEEELIDLRHAPVLGTTEWIRSQRAYGIEGAKQL